jgi:hypothetical protein
MEIIPQPSLFQVVQVAASNLKIVILSKNGSTHQTTSFRENDATKKQSNDVHLRHQRRYFRSINHSQIQQMNRYFLFILLCAVCFLPMTISAQTTDLQTENVFLSRSMV